MEDGWRALASFYFKASPYNGNVQRCQNSLGTEKTDADTQKASCGFASLPVRLQLKLFQRKADHVGACLDIANRPIQFYRDQFWTDICFRHFSKEVILSWRPPVVSGFDHAILLPLRL
jgi:hypothetical protein